MTKTSVKQSLYDKQVEEYSENDPVGLGMLHKHEVVLDLIYKYSHKKDNILDIGCSDGKILKDMEKKGYENLYGVDIQSKSATSLKGTSVKYKECDIEDEPIPFRAKFDIIILSDVLEHLYSPETVLEKLKKHLRPKGKIIFSVPNAGWFLNGPLLTFFPSKLFASTAFGPWYHTHQFTFYEFRSLAPHLGYRILDLKGERLDNYAFRTGIKKIIFDFFVLLTAPLTRTWPAAFSAHIFGTLEKE